MGCGLTLLQEFQAAFGGIGGRAVGVFLDDFLQAAFSARDVVQFDLAGGDDEQRIRRARLFRIALPQTFQFFYGAFEIAARVKRSEERRCWKEGGSTCSSGWETGI